MLYSTDREFVARTTQFIAEGLGRDEAVLTVVAAPKIAEIRRALRADADRVFFADMAQVGRNPALIIQAWRDFVAAHSNDGRAVRGIGEPITPARDDAALVECHIHESLLNLAFADTSDFWLLCPYDTSALSPEVLHHAVDNHPFVCDHTGHVCTSQHVHAGAVFAWPLPEPRAAIDEDVDVIEFDLSALSTLRAYVSARAVALGVATERVGELATAVSEIATNAILHGRADGTARIWVEDRRLVCEVRGSGRIRDPLIGRLRPAPGQPHGYGVWLANQFCDLVQIRSVDAVTTVRLHIRLA
jgi:anti-sigma regulatory factor (Ser/Thr protein kinase)